jgi:membrane-bound lytic murein transglycosylase D
MSSACAVIALLLAVVPQPSQAADTHIANILEEMLQRAEAEASSREQAPPSTDSAAAGAEVRTDSDPLGSVQKHVAHFSTTGRTHFNASVRRLAPMRATFEKLFADEGVPTDLIWLGLVESGYNASARSPKSAAGVWQFIPETAVRFGLSVGRSDERLDPVKSARAAARYLKFLYGLFADWNLALAAYNAGEQRVLDAIKRSGSRDFWRLSTLRLLPEETREYVPAVLAAQQLGGVHAEHPREAEATPRQQQGSVVYAQVGGME